MRRLLTVLIVSIFTLACASAVFAKEGSDERKGPSATAREKASDNASFKREEDPAVKKKTVKKDKSEKTKSKKEKTRKEKNAGKE